MARNNITHALCTHESGVLIQYINHQSKCKEGMIGQGSVLSGTWQVLRPGFRATIEQGRTNKEAHV